MAKESIPFSEKGENSSELPELKNFTAHMQNAEMER